MPRMEIPTGVHFNLLRVDARILCGMRSPFTFPRMGPRALGVAIGGPLLAVFIAGVIVLAARRGGPSGPACTAASISEPAPDATPLEEAQAIQVAFTTLQVLLNGANSTLAAATQAQAAIAQMRASIAAAKTDAHAGDATLKKALALPAGDTRNQAIAQALTSTILANQELSSAENNSAEFTADLANARTALAVVQQAKTQLDLAYPGLTAIANVGPSCAGRHTMTTDLGDSVQAQSSSAVQKSSAAVDAASGLQPALTELRQAEDVLTADLQRTGQVLNSQKDPP